MSTNTTKTIAVTGGTGFVGRHIIKKLLADGHHARVLSRSEDKARRVLDVSAIDDLGAVLAQIKALGEEGRKLHAEIAARAPRRPPPSEDVTVEDALAVAEDLVDGIRLNDYETQVIMVLIRAATPGGKRWV